MNAVTILVLFAACAVAIVVTGTRLSYYGDVIGDRSGLGARWIGVVAMASVTSLPELVTGASAVTIVGAPDIAVGDIVGSCLFNLLLLAGLDVASPRPLLRSVHPSHALTAALGATLLATVAAGIAARGSVPAIGWVGGTSFVLLVGYLLAVRAVFLHERATRTELLVEESVASPRDGTVSLEAAIRGYTANAVILVIAATGLPALATEVARIAALSQSFVGTTLVALTTSLPEIVVSIGAARLGAWDLAVANVLGSNLFNVAILAADDVLYADGPLLAAADPVHGVTAAAAAAMSALVAAALVARPHARGHRLSWLSAALAGAYVAATALVWH